MHSTAIVTWGLLPGCADKPIDLATSQTVAFWPSSQGRLSGHKIPKSSRQAGILYVLQTQGCWFPIM